MNEPLIGSEGKEKLFAGAQIVYDTVRRTIGARGKNVMINLKGVPYVTKDGINTIKNIKLSDPVMNMGAQFIRQASEKTAVQTGDATTTTAILTYQMAGIGSIKLSEDVSQVKLFEGMELAVQHIEEKVKREAIPATDDLVYSIANISSNNDASIAQLVAELMLKIGVTGSVLLDVSTRGNTYYELTNGMKLSSGFASQYMINNHNYGMMAFENPLILVTDETVTKLQQIEPFVATIKKSGRSGVIICPEIYGEALSIINMNVQQHKLPIGVVLTPDYGTLTRDVLEDIAMYVGAQLITDKQGRNMIRLQPSYLGTCTRFASDRSTTKILGGVGDVSSREAELKNTISLSKDLKEIDDSKFRLANITGKTAIIYMHADTESELNEKKDRLDDSIQACRAAMEEGVLPGGGLFLYNVYTELEKFKDDVFHEGYEVVFNSLVFPLMNILENGQIKLSDVEQGMTDTVGYNILTNAHEDMMVSGIVDPAKSIRVAVRNAFSAAKTLLSTEVVISNT